MYTVYVIDTESEIDTKDEAVPFEKKKYTTYRRFSEFQKLLCYLRDQENLKGILIPELPPKAINNLDKKIIEERRIQLEAFLDFLVANPEIRRNAAVRYFLLT
jgi:hypothetical protein